MLLRPASINLLASIRISRWKLSRKGSAVDRILKSASVFVLALFLAVGVSGCGNQYEDKVVGTWTWKVGGGALLVTINKDHTGTMKGPIGEKKLTWRIQRGNNFVFNDGGKDLGFVIDSADANTIQGSDPQAPGQKIVWTRK